MTVGPIRIARPDRNTWRMAAAGLLLAAVIVGVAILMGGPAARVFNALGALVWLASGVALARFLPAPRRWSLGWLVAIGGGVTLAALVRPSGLPETIAAFAIAGALVVLAAGDRVGAWALLAPAIYLPVHLLIGIGRALLRGGAVRTDPPPTAAIVPLALLLAAAIAGALAAALVRRRG